MTPRAVIAEDEPALAAELRDQLARVWPELAIAAMAHDGPDALAAIHREAPDVAFLDVRMPGLTGTQVAAAMPAGCRLVYVTAYDQHAVHAFDQGASDYLLKPITVERLARTRARLEAAWQTGGPAPQPRDIEREPRYLEWIRAALGERVDLIPVDDVAYFHARAKYTTVVTPERETVIRTPIKTLEAQLDPARFWRIHRATIVNLAAVAHARRLPGGRLRLSLKSCADPLTVSRAYADRFKEM